ncbi:anterior gradient protein 2-like isoform X2 [Hyla sarda]|uniref:anterior gradient protein 2-like isoform X2 n=1 Tax=Hyla sarda TaxID=327740 RepID=UPI0024C3C6ED|nr:anterior gradient protein 2-like isoform X2 [Hyla sarda]
MHKDTMQPNLFVCCLILLCTALGEAATRKPKKQPAPDSNTTAKPDPEPKEAPVTQPKTLARGWGESILWAQTYEEALAKSRDTRKPLMVIHHLEDCPFSQELKKAFAADAMAQKLAREDFVMLNVVHPVADDNQSPDGFYVPRVIFVDPSMTVRTDLAGRYSNRLYAYEAGDIPELITNMKKAKILLKTEL